MMCCNLFCPYNNNSSKAFKIMKKGMIKLERRLDIINILKDIKHLKVSSKLF